MLEAFEWPYISWVLKCRSWEFQCRTGDNNDFCQKIWMLKRSVWENFTGRFRLNNFFLEESQGECFGGVSRAGFRGGFYTSFKGSLVGGRSGMILRGALWIKGGKSFREGCQRKRFGKVFRFREDVDNYLLVAMFRVCWKTLNDVEVFNFAVRWFPTYVATWWIAVRKILSGSSSWRWSQWSKNEYWHHGKHQYILSVQHHVTFHELST